MKSWSILFAIFFGFGAWAQPQKSIETHYLVYAYPFTQTARFDRDENQQTRQFSPRTFGLGTELEFAELSFEYDQSSTDSSSGNLQIQREEKDSLFWARFPFYHLSFAQAFAGAGAGVYDEKIMNTFGTAVSVNTSAANWATGINLGLQFNFHPNLLLSLEARAIFGKNFDPQPQLGGLLRVGLRI